MGYSIISQLTGPRIDSSLLIDAARTGTAIGQATPSKLTSAIRGVEQGLQTGMSLMQSYESLQTSNIQQEGLRQQNELRALQIEQAKLSQADQIQVNDQALEAKKLELQQKIQNMKRLDEFRNQFKAAPNDDARADMLLSGNWADVMAAYPNEYQQYQGSVIGSANLTPQKYYGLMAQSHKQAAKSNAIAQFEASQKNLQTALDNLDKDPVAQKLAAATGMSPAQAMASVQAVDVSKYEKDAKGNLVLDNGSFKLTDQATLSPGAPKAVEFYLKDANGKMTSTRIKLDPIGQSDWEKSEAAFYAAKHYSSIPTTYLQSTYSTIDRQAQAAIQQATQPRAQQPQQAQAPVQDKVQGILQKQQSAKDDMQQLTAQTGRTFDPENPQARTEIKPVPISAIKQVVSKMSFKDSTGRLLVNTPTAKQALAASVGLVSPDDVSQADDKLSAVLSILEEDRTQDLGDGDAADRESRLQHAKYDLAAFVAQREWKSSKLIQTRYTMADVNEHNALAAEWTVATNPVTGNASKPAIDPVNPSVTVRAVVPSAYTKSLPRRFGLFEQKVVPAIQVSTPEELYYLERIPFFNSIVKQYADTVYSNINGNRKATANTTTAVTNSSQIAQQMAQG